MNRDAELLERMEKDLRLSGKAERTVEAYTGAVRRLVRRTGKPLAEIEEEDVREYLLGMIEKKVARGTFSINLCGIRFFWKDTMGLEWKTYRCPIWLFPATTRKGLKHSLITPAGTGTVRSARDQRPRGGSKSSASCCCRASTASRPARCRRVCASSRGHISARCTRSSCARRLSHCSRWRQTATSSVGSPESWRCCTRGRRR